MSTWPQWWFVVITILGLTSHLAYHGQPTGQRFNAVVKVICVMLEIFILAKGGFFAVWGW